MYPILPFFSTLQFQSNNRPTLFFYVRVYIYIRTMYPWKSYYSCTSPVISVQFAFCRVIVGYATHIRGVCRLNDVCPPPPGARLKTAYEPRENRRHRRRPFVRYVSTLRCTRVKSGPRRDRGENRRPGWHWIGCEKHGEHGVTPDAGANYATDRRNNESG